MKKTHLDFIIEAQKIYGKKNKKQVQITNSKEYDKSPSSKLRNSNSFKTSPMVSKPLSRDSENIDKIEAMSDSIQKSVSSQSNSENSDSSSEICTAEKIREQEKKPMRRTNTLAL